MISKAPTVEKYLASLPADRREALEAVRKVILKNLDEDYEEGMLYGMIGYYVPHRVFPQGYHCDPTKPLCYAGLASQKNYMAIYLMTVYGSRENESWFRTEWAKTGKKLDMGKSCIRFKKLEDIPLDVIGQSIARVPARKYLDHYQATLAGMNTKRPAKPQSRQPAATTKPPKKRPTPKPRAK